MPAGWAEWLILPSLGISARLGHWFMIKAYSHAGCINTGAVHGTCNCWWPRSGSWLVYDNLPDGFTLLGMLVILSSGSLRAQRWSSGRAPGAMPTRWPQRPSSVCSQRSNSAAGIGRCKQEALHDPAAQ